jgi:hypothetical protein
VLPKVVRGHISPTVAEGLRYRNRSLVVSCMAEWEGGEFLGQQDSACLQEATAQGLTLVTYDRRAIPPLLKAWAEEERRHGGVIFVDEKTISPSDAGGLVRALSNLFRETSKWDWTNRVCFLRRHASSTQRRPYTTTEPDTTTCRGPRRDWNSGGHRDLGVALPRTEEGRANPFHPQPNDLIFFADYRAF